MCRVLPIKPADLSLLSVVIVSCSMEQTCICEHGSSRIILQTKIFLGVIEFLVKLLYKTFSRFAAYLSRFYVWVNCIGILFTSGVELSKMRQLVAL